MTLGELYIVNGSWTAMSRLVLVDEDLAIIEGGIEAYFADLRYGKYEVFWFRGDLVILKKEEKYQ